MTTRHEADGAAQTEQNERTEQAETYRHMELLWRVGERPRRGPRPQLSLDAVVGAAVGVADTEGLGAVSMQRVAAELGYTTMSLYRYVQSKEQLVALMGDAALGEAPDLSGAGTWREKLEEIARSLAAVYRNRPWLLQVEISGPPVAPMQLTWFEAYLQAMAESGLRGYDRVAVVMFIDGAVRELSRVSVQIARGRGERGASADAVGADYAGIVRRFASPERYPNVAGLVAEGIFDPPASDAGGTGAAAGHGGAGAAAADSAEGAEWGLADEIGGDILFGLRRLLDGVEDYVRERARPEAD